MKNWSKKKKKAFLITLVMVLVFWPLIRAIFTPGAIVAMVAFYFFVMWKENKKS